MKDALKHKEHYRRYRYKVNQLDSRLSYKLYICIYILFNACQLDYPSDLPSEKNAFYRYNELTIIRMIWNLGSIALKSLS